jgi:two-component system, NtrC family, response regulator AtoC
MTFPTKILLIENDSRSREALHMILKRCDFAVVESSGGKEGLQHLTGGCFDVVISDLFLPDMTGIEILKQVKLDSPASEVILMAGHSSVETGGTANKEEAFDYVVKPLNLCGLHAILDEAVGNRQFSVTPAGIDMKRAIDELESKMIEEALQLTNRVVTRAAKLLSVNRTTLVEKMRSYNIVSRYPTTRTSGKKRYKNSL